MQEKIIPWTGYSSTGSGMGDGLLHDRSKHEKTACGAYLSQGETTHTVSS